MSLIAIPRAFPTVLLASLAACASPPDVAPFAEATRTLHLAVTSTARSAHDAIAASDAELAQRFDVEWEHRIKAIEAMDEYARSLVTIVQAGEEGPAAARAVLDSASQLFATLGAAYPLASEVGRKLEVGAVAAYRAYAKDSAARTVGAALERADPAVEEVADVLALDFEAMARIFEDLRVGARTDHIAREKQAKPVIGHVQSLEDEFEELNARLAGQFDATLVPQAGELAELLERERALPEYVEYVDGLRAIEARYDAYDAAARTAADLVRVWGQSHADLVRAAELGRTPSFDTLLALTADLLEVYEETRSIR
jgi:hypothetical protein